MDESKSDPTPGPPPSEGDLSGYYYRPGMMPDGGGDAEKLQALSDGYFGLNLVFVVNVVLALSMRALRILDVERAETALMLVLGAVILLFVVIALLSYPYNRKIAFGKGWGAGAAALASVLMGLNSVLCCGIIGFIVMQQIASNEMRRYGLKTAFFGIRKKDVERRIAELRSGPPEPVVPKPPNFQA